MFAANDPTTIGVLASILASLAAILVILVRGSRDAKEAAYHAAAANSAVNNRGPDAHNLYDLVTHQGKDISELVEAQRDFARRGWQMLPDDIGTAARLTETIRELQGHDNRIDEKLDLLLAELRSHVAWEETVKYPDVHRPQADR